MNLILKIAILTPTTTIATIVLSKSMTESVSIRDSGIPL